MIGRLAPPRLFSGVRSMIQRVKAREQQLVAWKHMLDARAVKRTRIALAVVDALRIGAFVLVVFETVRATERATPVAIAIMAAAWLALSGVHLALRDAILARAFATMMSSRPTSSSTSSSSAGVSSESSESSANTSGPPRVLPLSPGAQAALRRAQAPRKPKTRPKPAIVLADRDAVDFEDAMSGPVRALSASNAFGTSERKARDFDDA